MIDSQLREAVRLAGTPCYVFDARELRHRVAFLREHLPSEIGLCYAMKANPFLLKEISPLVDRIEICSPGELTIAGKLDIPLKQYVVSGVNKDPERMRTMVRTGTGEELYTVESMRQLTILLQSAQSDFNYLRPRKRYRRRNYCGHRARRNFFERRGSIHGRPEKNRDGCGEHDANCQD